MEATMKKLVLKSFILLFSFILINCSSTPNPERLDNYLIRQMRQAKIPGVSAIILTEGKVSWTGNFGYASLEDNIPVTENTLFAVASCSKPVTATAIMMIYENGFISLDSDINEYLPFSIRNPHFPNDEITIRMLLSHTSSLLDNIDVYLSQYTIESGGGDSSISLEEYIYNYFNQEGIYYDPVLNFNTELGPGKVYNYCNMGYALLGYILEQVTGQPFDEFCNKNIFTPLNMYETAWFLKDIDISKLAVPYDVQEDSITPICYYGFPSYPDGQLRTSALEYANFISMLLNDGSYNGEEILQPETINEFFKVQYPEVDAYQAIAWDYDSFESPMIRKFMGYKMSHLGGDPGIATMTIIDPEKKAAVIIFANGLYDESFQAMKAYWYDIVKALCTRAGIMI
jgi:CubicO group peptidase (beta-lactamase class C family)